MPRPLMTPTDLQLSEATSRLTRINPFIPERIDCEREALGRRFIPGDVVWSTRTGVSEWDANNQLIVERVRPMLDRVGVRLASAVPASERELELYEDAVLYRLYYDHLDILRQEALGDRPRLGPAFRRFRSEFERLLSHPGRRFWGSGQAAHVWSVYFQVCRAFVLIFEHIVGASLPAARLRAAAWNSIFTRDLGRYRRSLYGRMGDVTTLIEGPSGTGKELVARAIGRSRYLPYDAGHERFAEDSAGAFHVLNVAALSPTLVESELFGHRRGAFTGAVGDHAGWLETTSALGTVFLDEVGEVDPAIQVKLLRVLQQRTFQRIGETVERTFAGKILAATNRDLAAEMESGRFRKDFYYRLCSDVVRTPSLAEQLLDSPGELTNLVQFLALRIAGPDEAAPLTAEVTAWIHTHLGAEYPWPGNVRELEQCVRNVMIRGEYRPARPPEESGARSLADAMERGALTADQLVRRYCQLVHRRTGEFSETARRVGLDWRTVKAKVEASDS